MTGLTKLDDQAVWAWSNIRGFLDGVLIGTGALQTSMTDVQRKRWGLEWGTDYVLEQFLIGYQDELERAAKGWGDIAEAVWEFINDPDTSTRQFLASIKQVAATVADPSKVSDFKAAGVTTGEGAAGWLNESIDSPPEFAKKCGELAAKLVVEAIETLATAGVKKLTDITSIARKVVDKLPKNKQRKKKDNDKDDSHDETNQTRGIEDKGTGTKTKLDEVTPEVHKDVDEAFEKYTRDPKLLDSSVGDRGKNDDWTHDKRADKQDENEPLHDDTEIRRGGTRQDIPSASKMRAAAFARALNEIESSFKKHSVKAQQSLGPNFAAKLASMKGLRNEMADLAKTVRNRQKSYVDDVDGEIVDLVIRDENLLKRVAENYWQARKLAKAYGDIRNETWKRMFLDPALQTKLLDGAFPELRKRRKKLGKFREDEPLEITQQRRQIDALLRTATHDRKALWNDTKTREDILWQAYGLIWKKRSDDGKVFSPRSPVLRDDGQRVTDALELEHLLRQADNPYEALNPHYMIPTTKRINGTINEALRTLERQQAEIYYTHNPTDDDLITDLIRANKEALDSLKPSSK